MNKDASKRIVFFIESFSGGGAERVLYTILCHLNHERFDITVLVLNDVGVYREPFHALGLKIARVINSQFGLINSIKYKLLYRLLPTSVAYQWIMAGLKADTYVAFVEGYCTKLLSHLPKRKRKLAWVHIDLDSFPWTIEKDIFKNKKEEIAAYSKYDEVIGVSNEVTEIMLTKYQCSNAITIYNPIDESRITKMAKQTSPVEVDNTMFNIVSVGRLTHQKGYGYLIDMMPELLSANPKIRLYIVGEGEERWVLEQKINKLDLHGRVMLTGFLDNPYSLMGKMDLFVCSSVAEGFSLVIAEAMICGLPVVSMECAGPRELLGDGRYGILCKTHNHLATEIVRLSQDSSSLATLRDKANKRAAYFNTAKTIRQIENIL